MKKGSKKHRKLFAIACLATVGIGVSGMAFATLSVGAETSAENSTEEVVATNVASVLISHGETLHIYPTYYVLGEQKYEHNGSYVLLGKADSDISFKTEGNETVVYDVTLHDLDAYAQTWYGLMGIDENVTVNMTAVGVNRIVGYNHPGVQGNGTLDLTVAENSSVVFGSSYNGTNQSINENVTFNLLQGTADLDMSDESWRDFDLTVSNGEAAAHVMKYEYVDETYCKATCATCGELGNVLHETEKKARAEDDEHAADGHDLICQHCKADVGDEEHRYYSSPEKYNEEYCVSVCYECGALDLINKKAHRALAGREASCTQQALCEYCYEYFGEILDHSFGGDGVCTSCMESAIISVTVGDTTKDCVSIREAFSYADGKEATVTLLENAGNYDSVTVSAGNVTLDLAGFKLQASLYANGTAMMTVKDSSLAGTGSLNELVAYDDGKLIVESGEINGYIRLRNNASLVIEGGEFADLLLGIEDSSSVDIYGGTFTNLTSYNLLTDLLAADCYKCVDEDGDPIVFTDETQSGGYVKVVHFEAYETVYDEDSHWLKCLCGLTKEEAAHALETKYDTDGHWEACECGHALEKESHGGGSATCTDKAVCEDCAGEYGEALGHDYDNACDADCNREGCENIREAGKHVDEDGDCKCDECGMDMPKPETGCGGCGSVIGGGAAVAAIGLAGGCLLLKKKKEE